MSFFSQLFSSGGFQPHGFCYNWNTGLVWLHVVSDLLIAISYLTIPIGLIAFVRKRRDLPFGWMFSLFGVFIVACGATHFMEIWNLWHAQYWLAGAIKAVTAVASVATAILFARLVPAALRIPGPEQWAQATTRLEELVNKRTQDVHEVNTALRHSREALELAQKAAKIGTWDWDLRTQASTWTRELEEIYGFAPGTFDGRYETWRARVLPEDLPAAEEAFQRAAKNGGRVYSEYRILRLDGETRWVSAVGNIIRDDRGEPERMVGINTDITERKNVEQQARSMNLALETRVAERTRELSNANKELESFSYSVSHDLRSPLRTIDGFSLALLEDCGDQLDAAGKGHLQRIRAATQRMGTLIDDLLNLSRVTRAEISARPLDLSAIVSTIAKELQAAQPERQVTWRIQSGLSATGDAHMLRVAVENLLANAWKFTSTHHAAAIEFGTTQAKGESAFFVKDDGVGFDPAYADRLFGAFQRLHAATEFPGTGVGLATVQRIIHRHGGRVWAESSLDHGATFYFTLPQNGANGARG